MESKSAIAALGALAQETRLEAFRALVQAGPNGIAAGTLAERLGVPAPTLSFHLAQLKGADLVDVRRAGRSLVYAARFDAMTALVGYLTENCCEGAAVCAPACGPTVPTRKEDAHEEAPRPRRRA